MILHGREPCGCGYAPFSDLSMRIVCGDCVQTQCWLDWFSFVNKF